MEMPDDPEKGPTIFSVPTTDLYEFFEEAENQVIFSKELLNDYLDEGSDYLVGSIGEMCSLASKMSFILQDILENVDPKDEVTYIHPKDMMILQSLLLTRHYLIVELEEKGISFACH